MSTRPIGQTCATIGPIISGCQKKSWRHRRIGRATAWVRPSIPPPWYSQAIGFVRRPFSPGSPGIFSPGPRGRALRPRMRAVVQRVAQARVEVDGAVVGAIGPGLCVLLGVRAGDTEDAAAVLS